MRCPQCRNNLIQKSGDLIKVRVRGVLEQTSNGTCRAQCHYCRKPVTLPFTLVFQKSEEPEVKVETFVVRLSPRTS